MSKIISKVKQAQLKQQQREAELQTILSFSKKRFKKFETVIEALYQNSRLEQFAHVDERMVKLADCFKKIAGKQRQADKHIFKELLLHLEQSTGILKDSTLIGAVFNICRFRVYWQQGFATWMPMVKKPADQLQSLIAHLFCRYQVPLFLYKVFWDSENDNHIHWFVFLANGGKVKQMRDIPIAFTQKTGHYFLKAPASYTVREALRWAQVKALNGTDVLAQRVAHSWLALKPYTNEDFWESFIRLIAQDSMFNPAKIGELIDYVREEKRLNAAYSLKGRTIQSLLRQSDAWHSRFGTVKGNEIWKPCGIAGWMSERERDNKKEVLLLEELAESRLLVNEGKTMRHCVASYAYYCARGRTAIFSLRKYVSGILSDTLATIEVNLSVNRVVQAKGKMNQPISEEAKKILFQWAGAQQLGVSAYL